MNSTGSLKEKNLVPLPSHHILYLQANTAIQIYSEKKTNIFLVN